MNFILNSVNNNEARPPRHQQETKNMAYVADKDKEVNNHQAGEKTT